MRGIKYIPHPDLSIRWILLSCAFSAVNLFLGYAHSRLTPALVLGVVFGLLIVIMAFDTRPQSRNVFSAVTFVLIQIILSVVMICVGILPVVYMILLAAQMLLYIAVIGFDVAKKRRVQKGKNSRNRK